MKTLIFLIPLIILLPSCNDNSNIVKPSSNVILEDDTTILRTDEFGNSLGGDTTDWCHYGGPEPIVYSLSAAYPNPVITDTVAVHFSLPYDSHIKIYFKNNADTLFVFNQYHNRGFYVMYLSKSYLGYNNQYKRIYMSADNFYCYGDIKF